jgi:hypothetical protein
MGSSMQKYVAPNYLASRVCVERTLDNPARASISRKSFSLVRFKASLWVRFLFGWVVGNWEVDFRLARDGTLQGSLLRHPTITSKQARFVQEARAL